ncbi:MAG: NAD(P)H-hydrate dehydratase [Candidatus Omnitrophota bacterium]
MKKITNLLPKRKIDSHKGDYGHVLVLAGSVGMTGAAYLCSQAAIMSGCGLVTLGIPRSLNKLMEIKLTEVITKPLTETREQTLGLSAYAEILRLTEKIDVLIIGPGLSTNLETQLLVRRLIKSIKKPMVLDADGINALIGSPGMLKKTNVPFVITPHPGEMAKLIGVNPQSLINERKNIAKSFAHDYRVTTVLKGHRTIIASPDGSIYINETGNPGMATAGSGDILSGMIGSFMAQGIQVFDAAKLACYLHGLAGDLAASEKGEYSLIAGDILKRLPDAFLKLQGKKK